MTSIPMTLIDLEVTSAVWNVWYLSNNYREIWHVL